MHVVEPPHDVMDEGERISRALCAFIRTCPSPFHTVHEIRSRLDHAGFQFISESWDWEIRRGGAYYTIRNGSSIIAFRVGSHVRLPRFGIAISHADSPTFRVKAIPELKGPKDIVRINVEGYGGTIDRTWLDRPLSVAGRVMVRQANGAACILYAPEEDLLLIPSLAIHLDREVNQQGQIQRQNDICALFSAGALGEGAFLETVARHLGVDQSQILSYDLTLVNRQEPVVWGAAKEFVSAPRLDDLQCAYASLEGFLAAENERSVAVYACLNNEEVGSSTMQGALSTFASDVLKRVCACLGVGVSEYKRSITRSFVVSCDNAHAVHPNHPERYDEQNRAWLNKGVVIKESANQRYTTDAVSHAFFKLICERANVPTQCFSNRSDMPGGSTLGNLLTHQVSMRSVDVGLPQLAMHSSYETAGTADAAYLARALREFYDSDYLFLDDGSFELS